MLELLVALSVFAVMGVAAYTGLAAVVSARAGLQAEAQRLAELQIAFTLLQRDIEQAVARPVRDEFGIQRPALQGGREDGELLALTRNGWHNPLQLRRPELRRIRYRLHAGELLRGDWVSLDRAGITAPRDSVLVSNVTAVQLRFMGAGKGWRDDWPPTSAEVLEKLPRAVEVRVQLPDWGELVRVFLLVETT